MNLLVEYSARIVAAVHIAGLAASSLSRRLIFYDNRKPSLSPKARNAS